jgi:hypothetical protein
MFMASAFQDVEVRLRDDAVGANQRTEAATAASIPDRTPL